jgi:hypothetical protein
MIVECVQSLIHAKNLALNLWAEAMQTTAYLLNRVEYQTPLVEKRIRFDQLIYS